MKAIIEHIVLVTRLLGAPVSEAALSAEVVRDKKLKVNYHSLVEVLRSHGFENTLSKRNLEDIPSLAVPVMIILHNEEAAVITQSRLRPRAQIPYPPSRRFGTGTQP